MVYPQTWWFRMSVFPLIGNLAGITNFQIQMGMGQNWYTLQNYQWIRGPRNLDPWLSLSLSTGEIWRIWIPPTAFPRNWTYPSGCWLFVVWCVGLMPKDCRHISYVSWLYWPNGSPLRKGPKGHRYGTWFRWADCDHFTWVCLRCFVHEFWQGNLFFLSGCVSMNPYEAAIVPGCEIQ